MVRELINKLKGLIKVGPLWVQILDHVSNNDWADARSALVDFDKWGPETDPEKNLIWALVLSRLDEDQQSFSQIEKVREALLICKGYSEQDLNYMHCYADRIVNKLNLPANLLVQYYGDFSIITKDKVSKVIKRNFPLDIKYLEDQ